MWWVKHIHKFFAAPPTKTRSLFPQHLNLDWPCAWFSQCVPRTHWMLYHMSNPSRVLLASLLILFGCSHYHEKELHPACWRMRGLWKRSWYPGWPPQAAAKCEWGHLGWTSLQLTCQYHRGRALPSQLYPSLTVNPKNQDQINGWLFWTTKSWGRVGSSPAEGVGYPLQYSWTSLVGSVNKESACNVGDPGLIPVLGRPPGGGHGYLLQYSCLGNPMDRGDWWAMVHGVKKSWTQLSD